MKSIALLIVAGLALPLVACDRDQAAADGAIEPDKAGKTDTAGAPSDPHAAFTDLSPDAVQKLVDDKGCVPVDANGQSTREKYGVVPGALLLSGADFKTTELPDDKDTKLVFYCGGKACTAAPKAAKLAQEAGYADVNVMRDGIRGWVDAGKNVDKPKS